MNSGLLVNQLTDFIQSHLNDENAGRVALYHYLKNFCRETDPVHSNLINKFFAECLQLAYWQERKIELFQDVKDLLVQFHAVYRVVVSLDPIWDLTKCQVLALSQSESLYHTVKNYEQGLLTEAETLRIIPDGENRMISLKKNSSGQIAVRTFNNQVQVRGHLLLPLARDQELFYNPILELQTNIVQSLRLTPHMQVRFEINESGVIAQTISGYAFRQTQILKLAHLGEFPSLFYHLKRLERYYVLRATDPYYVELISTLDKALQLLQKMEPGAENFARHVFESAQIAFDQVFTDDKTLYIKLKELAKGMTVQTRRSEEVQA